MRQDGPDERDEDIRHPQLILFILFILLPFFLHQFYLVPGRRVGKVPVMGGKRFRRRAWFLVGLTAVAALVGWRAYLGRRAPRGPLAVMNDGRPLVLKGVTFGTRHTNSLSWGNKLGTVVERIRWSRFARRFIPRIEPPGSRTDQVMVSEPLMVLWLASNPRAWQSPMAVPPRRSWAVPPPRAPTDGIGGGAPFLRWQIIGPGGVAHGGSAFEGVNGASSPTFAPLYIDSYPRRLADFTVGVFETTGGDAEPTLIGEFAVRNPQPNHAPFWQADSLPHRLERGELVCVLQDFQPSVSVSAEAAPDRERGPGELRLREPGAIRAHNALTTHRGTRPRAIEIAAPWFNCRDDHRRAVARFHFQSADGSEDDWDVRQFLLWDPTGNVSYACSTEWESLSGGGRQLTCSTLPLWPDDPAWKAQLYLVKTNALPTNRTVRLSGIPFPRLPGTNRFVLETNLFGWHLSVRADDINPNSPPTPLTSWPPDTIRFEFERDAAKPQTLPRPMLRLIEFQDQSGNEIPSRRLLHPDYQSDVGRWFLALKRPSSTLPTPTPPVTSVDLILGFPEERTFEFFVPSHANAAP